VIRPCDLAARYRDGASLADLEALTGWSDNTLRRLLARAGVEMRPAHRRRVTDLRRGGRAVVDASRLAARYLAGETLADIAARSGLGVSTVRRTLLRAGVTLRPAHRRREAAS
jgi:lambda repressor-like predicted transcriptional regulator